MGLGKALCGCPITSEPPFKYIVSRDAGEVVSTAAYRTNQLLWVDWGALGLTTYGYDAHGRRSSVTDSRAGTETSYQYDHADRQTKVIVMAI